MPKNWCFWTVVLEKTLESPLDCKEIKPVHLKGNQSWIFIGRTDEAETSILWPSDVKNWLILKDPDTGKDWRKEEKGTTEDELVWMVSPTQWTWVWLSSGVVDGQGSLTCCSPWGCKESRRTEWLNWTEHLQGKIKQEISYTEVDTEVKFDYLNFGRINKNLFWKSEILKWL